MKPTSPQIAILGAGPTGLEATLAAAEKGWPFTLYEARPSVGAHIRTWGHVRLFSPWDLDVSPRMRRHLEAAGHDVPGGEGCPTGSELVEKILEPVATLPAIGDQLLTSTRVLAVGRHGLFKDDEIGTGERSRYPFRLLLADSMGNEWTEAADVVLDCTGTYGNPNALGDGGIPAPGEGGLDEKIVRWIPNVLFQSQAWAGKTTLLVGAGYSAQTAVRDLAALAEGEPETKIIWALRDSEPEWRVDPDDPLPERARLSARARDLAAGASPAVETLTGVVVENLQMAGNHIAVGLRSPKGELLRVEVDRILSLTGYIGDHSLYRQLQVHECWATSGPMKLSASLLAAGGDADCLTQEGRGVDTLVNPEPGFFILGSKSYGRNSSFLMRVGWQQVDEVFTLLAS